MRVIPLFFVLLALAACGRKAEAPSPAPAPEILVSEVAAADGYGEPGEKVNAVAFWSHPAVAFESLVLAAGEAGLDAYAIETGERAARVETGPASGVAVVYFGKGAGARGYAIVRTGTAYAVHAIDNATREFTPVAVNGGAGAVAGGGAFCAGRSGEGVAFYEIDATGLSRRAIDEGFTLGEPQKIDAAGGVSCAVDDRTGEVVAISEDGIVRRVDPETEESFGVAIIDGAPVAASALILKSSGGAIAVLDGAAGVIRIIDLAEGTTLGAVRIKSTFDLDGVKSAQSIAGGYGNYGGVYRDGALAVVTAGDGPPVRLVPWNGVVDAIGGALADGVSPRDPQPEAEDEGVLSIEFEQP